VETFRIILKVG